MSLFDSIKNLLGGATDAVGGLTENLPIQDIQEHITTVTDGATEAVTAATEQGQTAVDDVKQNFGL